MSIADDTLQRLESAGLVKGRRIADIVLTRSYAAVVMDTGAVGWALNYAGPAGDIAWRETRWLARTARDPLLRDALFAAAPGDVEAACLRTALLAALSEPALDDPRRYGLRVTGDLPPPCLRDARHAAVVGFGGLMWRLLGVAGLRSLVVLDLGLAARRQEMENAAAAMRIARPDVGVRLSDGADWQAVFAHSDTLAITGSTLCNDTLDPLLAATRAGQTVIVQGQSVALHPGALFDRGVAAVMTTRKPPALAVVARADRSGAALEPWFEGGNARCCLLPPLRIAGTCPSPESPARTAAWGNIAY